MELTVLGQYYDLPILVDGLYRQAWPVEILRIEAETPKLGSATVRATLQCRFHRAARPDEAWVRQEGDALFPDEPGGSDALVEAARVHLLEAFKRDAPELERRSQRNRELVMRRLPGALHKLPQSPVGWVELTLQDDAFEVRLEP